MSIKWKFVVILYSYCLFIFTVLFWRQGRFAAFMLAPVMALICTLLMALFTFGVLEMSFLDAQQKQSTRFDTQQRDALVCPTCGHVDSAWEIMDGSGDVKCKGCGNLFHYQRNIKITYTTSLKGQQ